MLHDAGRALLIVAALTGANLAGLQHGKRIQNALSVSLVIGIVAIIVIGLVHPGRPAAPGPAPAPQGSEGALRGDDLRFALDTGRGARVLRFQGRVEGDTIRGTVAPQGRPDEARAFTASRRRPAKPDPDNYHSGQSDAIEICESGGARTHGVELLPQLQAGRSRVEAARPRRAPRRQHLEQARDREPRSS